MPKRLNVRNVIHALVGVVAVLMGGLFLASLLLTGGAWLTGITFLLTGALVVLFSLPSGGSGKTG
jgi:hypothetical protein